jgi:hypothetical protein
MNKWNREAGTKPDKKLLQEASAFAREKTKDHYVVAMAMRPDGVTQPQVIAIFGKPHRNKLRELANDNRIVVVDLPRNGRVRRVKIIPRC